MRKPRKLRVWHWSDVIYENSIVLLNGEWEDARKWMDDQFADVPPDFLPGGRQGRTIWIERDNGTALVLWFPHAFDVTSGHDSGVLAHESFHAADFTLKARGLTMTDASDEAYAYYIAYIFRECHKRLSRRRG